MNTPPFQLARLASNHPEAKVLLHDHRFEPPSPSPRPPIERADGVRRARLAELDAHLHCSVIGTCLPPAELRKLVLRHTRLDREHASDLQIHHAAIELAALGADGAKALHKALDHRHAPAIKRFGQVQDEDALHRLWADALKTGEVPPAYWAILTHPASTPALRQIVFGDVHMLSHQIGAANRADMRRLVDLEDENAGLKDKLERQRNRLQTFTVERDAEVRELRATVKSLSAKVTKRAEPVGEYLCAEVTRLRIAVGERDEVIALHTNRCVAAERRFKAEQTRAQILQVQLDEARELIDTMKSEADLMEQTVLRPVAEPDGATTAFERMRGKRIVYVGGRPGSSAIIRRLVESAGGWLILHDGGIEDRKGKLAASIPGADLVVFPVDCIDHDSMNMVKRTCDRYRIAYQPLRTASVASFVASMARDRDEPARPSGCSPVSAFCIRHG